MTKKFSAIVEKENAIYVALCPELDVVSQGRSLQEAVKNLKEAVTLFLETASPDEYSNIDELYLTTLDIEVAA